MKIKRIVLLISLVTVWASGAPAIWAGGGDAPLELRSIMQELSADMEGIVRGIAAGDMAAVEEHAGRVADHRRQPAAEMQGIINLLGPDMPAFKGIDTVVHDGALGLAEAARAGDSDAVVEGFKSVLSGCVECHARFRGRVIERFYGEGGGMMQ